MTTVLPLAVPTMPNGGNHTAEFAAAAGTPEAHAETLKVAKALSLLGFRVLDDDGFFNDVRIAPSVGCEVLLKWSLGQRSVHRNSEVKQTSLSAHAADSMYVLKKIK